MNTNAVVVVGTAYGDEGKGRTVASLAGRFGRRVTVARFNGASQAAHNVVSPDGTWHCFAQFGSGSFERDARTILGPGMLVDLDRLAVEADVLSPKIGGDAWSRLTVDPDCLLITPMQVAAGRLREVARGSRAHGSCGLGVGETVFDAEAGRSLCVRDLSDGRETVRRLDAILDAKRAEFDQLPDVDTEVLYERYRQTCGRFVIEAAATALHRDAEAGNAIVFEGAQGALLDRRRGFVPHVTKTDTTAAGALALARDAGLERPFVLGALRVYGHRHGAGPFVAEDESTRPYFDDLRNVANRWQGTFRVGWIDLPALRYGIRINGGLDGLSLTCLDQLAGLERIRACVGYVAPGGTVRTDIPDFETGEERTAFVASCRPEWIDVSDDRSLVRLVERETGIPVRMLSNGPRSDQTTFCD